MHLCLVMTDITKRFDLSAKMVKLLKPGATDTELLKLYGLFKQSNFGDCNITEPSKLFNLRENAKWNAWNSVKGLKKYDAMNKYSDIAMILIDKYGIKK